MEYRIGNTADFGVSELDEGQALCLLSAVGGHGLSLVEPGPASDPVGAGLASAIRRAFEAWRETQPQLFWTDENLWGGLDGQRAGASLPVEPVAPPSHRATGSALAFNGDGANHMQGARRPQKGA